MLEAAFYGDDFTGSTDALLQFERCGLRAVLLVDLPPTDELRDLATRYDVIGVAGIARSLAPDDQEAEIRPILTALRDLNPRVVQYKICSTADSSPHLGSIGRALEVGRSVFGPTVVPVLAAQPELGRYTVFSHHFAAEAGTIHRLDRQPTMANHPATPITESDLRAHLAAQTNLQIGALHLTTYPDLPTNDAQPYAHLPDRHPQSHADLPNRHPQSHANLPGRCPQSCADPTDSRAQSYTDPTDSRAQSYVDLPDRQTQSHAGLPEGYARSSDDAVILDALTDADLRLLGQTLVASSNGRPLFAIGSGGLSRALAMNLATPSAAPSTRPRQGSDGTTTTPRQPSDAAATPATSAPPPDRPQVLVVSGSQSTRTREQIEHAVRSGWLALELRDPTVAQQTAVAALHDGAPGVVVHTGEAAVMDMTAPGTTSTPRPTPYAPCTRARDGTDGTDGARQPNDQLEQASTPAHDLVGSLGDSLAAVAREIIQHTDVRRLIIAGGDTSGRVVRNLGVTALELLSGPNDLGPGTALCRVTSVDSTINGLHVLLKGGQIGLPTLFETFRTT